MFEPLMEDCYIGQLFTMLEIVYEENLRLRCRERGRYLESEGEIIETQVPKR